MMFRRNSLFIRILAGLLLAGLLVAAGAWVYQAGMAQGYAAGVAQSAAQGDTQPDAQGGTQVRPYGPFYPRSWPGFYGPRFGVFPFFPLFGCLIGLLLLFAFGALFRGAWFGSRPWGYAGPPHSVTHTHTHSHPYPHSPTHGEYGEQGDQPGQGSASAPGEPPDRAGNP